MQVKRKTRRTIFSNFDFTGKSKQPDFMLQILYNHILFADNKTGACITLYESVQLGHKTGIG